MKKIIFILLSISLYAADPSIRTAEFPAKEMKAQKVEIAKLMAKEINSSLPQVVDKYTTLTSVKSKNATLVYTFEINTGAKSDDSIRKEDRSRMRKAVTTGICQSSEKLLLAGISTSYIYISSKTKAHLFQFDISQKDCLK